MLIHNTTIILLSLLLQTSVLHLMDDSPTASRWFIPLDLSNRKDFNKLFFEQDSHFLAKRSAGHLHTGIDITGDSKSPGRKVLAAAAGKVVSIYAVEPNRAIIIKHILPSGTTIYSVYVHVTDIKVSTGDIVNSSSHIANLMNRKQLDLYGWDFNHLHFEILREPRTQEGTGKFLSFSTKCKTEEDVMKHFFNPELFLKEMWLLETPVNCTNRGHGQKTEEGN